MQERDFRYFIVNGITISRSVLALTSISMVVTKDTTLMTVGLLSAMMAMSLDMVDGNLARRWHVVSPEGAQRDAIADVTMVTAGLFAVGLSLDGLSSACWITGAMVLVPWFGFVRWNQTRRI